MPEMSLFALAASQPLGDAIAARLGVALAAHEEREFEDGEHKSRPLESVRGSDVYVVQSLHGDGQQSPNDKLCRLLFFLGALRDAGAARLTAVAPYLCYARKDRKTKPRDPVTTRYVAALFEAVGVDRVVTLDVHNLAAFQNAFRCSTEHLEARPLFVRHLLPQLAAEQVTVVSPDAGGVKRADRLRESLERALAREVGSAFMEKLRSAGVVSGERLVGDVAGRVAVIVDDLISTGTTLARAAAACQRGGARRVLAVATHGLFAAGAVRTLAESALDSVVVTNSVQPRRLDPDDERLKLVVLDATEILAPAILRLHSGGSIEELLAL